MEAAVVANVFVAASSKIFGSLLNEKTERFRAVDYHFCIIIALDMSSDSINGVGNLDSLQRCTTVWLHLTFRSPLCSIRTRHTTWRRIRAFVQCILFDVFSRHRIEKCDSWSFAVLVARMRAAFYWFPFEIRLRAEEKMNNMDALLSDLDYVLRDVQAVLREGMPCLDADADSLSWLNVSVQCFFYYLLNFIMIIICCRESAQS